MTRPTTLRITGSDRVMVLAVHPDDESLATGGLLQRAINSGAAVRVLFVTDGENNPWPQRVIERRWRIGPGERTRWGRRRREEALSALARLGVPAADARFLGWPDQGLTRLLLGGASARKAGEALARHVRDWRPTMLFAPSVEDQHPDHNALAVLVRLALIPARVGGQDAREPAIFNYLVHGPGPAAAVNPGVSLPLFVWEKYTKRAAIAEHASQLRLSRRRFLAYATDRECFARADDLRDSATSAHKFTTRAATFTLDWQLDGPWRVFERPRLHFVFTTSPAEGAIAAWALPLKKTGGNTPILRAADGTVIGEAEVKVERRRVLVRLPAGWRPPSRQVYVKWQWRRTFLDAYGWQELSLPAPLALPSRAPWAKAPSRQPLLASG